MCFGENSFTDRKMQIKGTDEAFPHQEEKARKEDEEAKKKADGDAKKKLILSNLSFTGYKVTPLFL